MKGKAASAHLRRTLLAATLAGVIVAPQVLVSSSVFAAAPSPSKAGARATAPVKLPPSSGEPEARQPKKLSVGEQPERRTRYSSTRYEANHTFTTKISIHPVNYRVRNGGWEAIDSTLVSTSIKGYSYQNRANSFQALFKQTLGDDYFRLVTDGQPVSLSLVGASHATASVKGSSIEYANALPHVTARYGVGPQGVEETLVLQDRAAASSYRFLLKAPAGTTADRQPDGRWAFGIPARAQPAFFLTRPLAYDSASRTGDLANPHAQMDVRQVGEGFQVDLAIDQAWLKDPTRRYPVFLDPTLTVQPDLNDAAFQADCPGCTPSVDTTTGRMSIGTDSSHVWREAMQFDLSAIPAGVNVTSAALGIYFDGYCLSVPGPACGGTSHQIDAHLMTAAWSTSSTTSQLTYNLSVLSSFTLPSNAGAQWMNWNVTAGVNSWIGGTQANYGLYLMRSSEPLGASGPNPPGTRYAADSSLTPQLTVTFTGDAVALYQPTVLHSNGAELSWSQYTGPSGAAFQKYEVHRSTIPNFTPSSSPPSSSTLLTSINDYTVTNYRDTKAAPNKTFYYAVVANTSKSNEIKAALPADGQATMFLQPGPSDGKATFIEYFAGSTNCANYGANENLWAGSDAIHTDRSLVQFNLQQIPTNASNVSATLGLWHLQQNTRAIGLHAYPVTRSWSEGRGTSSPPACTGDGATWYETTGGTSWTAQGGDFDGTTASSQVSIAANEAPQWSSFDVSGIVSRWVSGQAPNLGFIVKTDDESLLDGGRTRFASDDYSSAAAQRPRLQVTYVDGSHAIAPTVSISTPAPGAMLSGSMVQLGAAASDDRYVSQVQFFMDGAPFLPTRCELRCFPRTWDVTSLANGSHTLTATATDDAGNSTTSAGITVIVNNYPAPTTSITSPANNATGLQGTVIVSTSNSVASGLSINRVELYVDGALYATSTASPYSFSWNTLDQQVLTAYDGVPHSLTTKVYDSSGLVANSAPTSVTIANTSGTPYVAAFSSTAVPQTMSYDPSASSQLNYPVDVTITNNSSTNWDTTYSLVYSWYNPSLGPNLAFDVVTVAALSLVKGKTTTIRAQVAPPALADGVNAAQYRLAFDVVRTQVVSCREPGCPMTVQTSFLSQGNQPLDNPVIINKVLKTKLGLEHFYQYTSIPVGAGMNSMVNVANGNSLLNMTPISAPGRGLSTFVELTYNSLEEHSESPAGNNWSLAVSSLTRFGKPLDIHPNNADTIAGRSNKFVEFVDADGTLQHFDGMTGSDGVTFWKEPPGVHLYLRSVTTDTTNPKYWAITRPDRVTFYFNSDGFPTFVTDKNGNTISFTLAAVQPGDDPGGPKFHITNVTDASGQGTSPAPNRNFAINYFTKATARKPQIRGKVASIIDHLGHEFDFSYYDDGNLLSLTERGGTNADGSFLADRSWIFTYTTSDGSGPAIPDPSQRVNPNPKTPNESTRIYSARDPLGHETLFTYNGPTTSQNRWKVASIQDRAGNVSSLSYDNVSLVTTVAAPTPSGQTARTTKYAYDVAGRPTTITDPLGQNMSLQWSADNAVTKLTEQNTNFVRYAYNDNGYLTDKFDQLGNHTVLTYQNVAADANDISAHWNPAGGANGTGRTMPHLSQLATKQDPKEVAGNTPNKWIFCYDGNGNLVSTTAPIAGLGSLTCPATTSTAFTATNTYNADGTLATTTDLNGNKTTFASYDANGLPTKVVDATDNPSAPTHPIQFGYDAGGRMLFVQDSNHARFTGGTAAQYQTQFFYDSFNRQGRQSMPKLTGLTDLVWADTAYDANNNVVRQVAPHYGAQDTGSGDTTTASYDAMDRLTQVIGPDTMADPAGERTRYQYDVAGRLTQVTLPLGVQNGTPNNTHTVNYAYDGLDRATVQTVNHDTGSGIVALNMLRCFDLGGNLVSVTAPKANLSSVSCPATTATPFTTVYGYDADHRLTSVSDPLNHQIQLAYDANGNRTQVTDAKGNHTSAQYDALNRVFQIDQDFVPGDPTHAKVTTRIEYDANGNVTRQISPRAFDASADKTTFANYVTAFHYDALNRMVMVDLPVGPSPPHNVPFYIHNAYDFNGKLLSTSLPVTTNDPSQVSASQKAQLSYFDPGWIATSQDPGNPRVHFDYTAKGEQSLRTPENSSGALDLAKQIQWTYLADGQVQNRKDPQGQPINYFYDAENHLVASHDASGLTTPSQTFVDTQNTYDDLGRLVRSDLKKKNDANWTFSSFAYDANSNITDQVQNGKESLPGGILVKAGRSLHSDYDGADWITTQFDYGSGTPSSPGADAQRTVNMFFPNGQEASREIDKPDGAGGWTRKQLTTWDYFANGKLNHLTTTGAFAAQGLESHTVSYLDTGGIYVDGNRTQDVFSLQPGGGASTACAPGTTCTATYVYDPRDRLVSQTDSRGGVVTSTAYTLDASGNILSEAVNGTTTKTYSYNVPNGNLLKQVTSGGQTTNYQYDDLGRLHCVTTAAGSAADCGSGTTGPLNLITDYEYDYLDRLSTYQAYSGGNRTDFTQYTYDALNRVAQEDELHPSFSGNTRTTQFSYLGQSGLLTEEQQSNSTGILATKDYTYDAFGHRLSQTVTGSTLPTVPNGTFTYGYDVHGSVSQLVDGNGKTQASYGYRPYGQTDTSLTQGDTDQLNPLNPFRFSAKRQDTGSGTLDMGVRRFGPDTSHFLTPDLFFGALSNLTLSLDVLTQNRYGLAGGNPISFREWDGHGLVEDGGGGATPDPEVWKPVQEKLVKAIEDATSDDPNLVVRGGRWFRDPRTREIIEHAGSYQLPDVVVVNQDEKTVVLIGEAKSGSQRNLNTVWDQLQQRVDDAKGKADDAILVAVWEHENGERQAFINNGDANPDLADKIEASLNDQGITVERLKQRPASYVPRPSGLLKDPIGERDPIREGITYEPRGPHIAITTRLPAGPRCCSTTILELPRFKEIFPIDPLARVRQVASSIWPF